MSYTLTQFVKMTDEYKQYKSAVTPTQMHQIIELLSNNNAALECLAKDLWQPTVTLKPNQIIESPNMPENVVAKVTVAGTTGTTEPSWPTLGSSVTDGSVTYLMVGKTGHEIATAAEATAGTNNTKIMTPSLVKSVLPTKVSQLENDSNFQNGAGSVAYATNAGTAGNASALGGIGPSGYLQLSNGYLPDVIQYRPDYILRVGNWYGGTIELNGQNHTEFYGSAGFKIDANPNFYLIGKSTGVLSWNGTRFEFGGNNASANGYTTLNNGFIIQWGIIPASTNGYIAFPVTFNTCFGIVSGLHGVQYDENDFGFTSYSNAGFTAYCPAGRTLRYIAIGI